MNKITTTPRVWSGSKTGGRKKRSEGGAAAGLRVSHLVWERRGASFGFHRGCQQLHCLQCGSGGEVSFASQSNVLRKVCDTF